MCHCNRAGSTLGRVWSMLQWSLQPLNILFLGLDLHHHLASGTSSACTCASPACTTTGFLFFKHQQIRRGKASPIPHPAKLLAQLFFVGDRMGQNCRFMSNTCFSMS